jgi:hypothetical protein
MATTTRNSSLYTRVYVNKYLSDARDHAGRILALPFSHTVVSGETAGASAGVQDHVNLCVIPAYAMVIDIRWVADALWATVGTNGTLEIGDSGDQDRYVQATELYTADPGGPIATEGMKRQGLAFAGQNYRTTADTIVYATYKVANPVVGKTFKGYMLCVQADR